MLVKRELWCGRRDLNPGSPAWKAGVLVQARRRPPAQGLCRVLARRRLFGVCFAGGLSRLGLLAVFLVGVLRRGRGLGVLLFLLLGVVGAASAGEAGVIIVEVQSPCGVVEEPLVYDLSEYVVAGASVYVRVSCNAPESTYVVSGYAVELRVEGVSGGSLTINSSVPVRVVVRGSFLSGPLQVVGDVYSVEVRGSYVEDLLVYWGFEGVEAPGRGPPRVVVEDSRLCGLASFAPAEGGLVELVNVSAACDVSVLARGVSVVARGVSEGGGSWSFFVDGGSLEIVDSVVSGSVAVVWLEPPGGVLRLEGSLVGRPGGFNESGVSVPVTAYGSLVAVDSEVYASSVEVYWGWLNLSWSRVEAGRVLVSAGRGLVARDSAVSAGSLEVGLTGGGFLEFSGSSLRLSSPMLVSSRGGLAVRVSGSMLQCGGSCISIGVLGGSVDAVLEDSVFRASGAALTVYSYPPASGEARVVARSCYFGSPLGPKVIVSGRLMRDGGAALALAGSMHGSIVVESWRVTEAGPVVYPSEPPEGVSVEVRGAKSLVYLGVEDGPSGYAVLASFPRPVRAFEIRVEGGVPVKAMGGGVWGTVEGEGPVYLVRLPYPSSYALVLLRPAPAQQPEPGPAPTTSTEAPSGAGGAGEAAASEGLLSRALLAAAGLAAVALAAVLAARGRGRG